MSFLPNSVLGGNKTRQSFTRQLSDRASCGGQTPAVSFLFKRTEREENPIPLLLRGRKREQAAGKRISR